MTPSPQPPIADVALILEGTYPFVLGGVSAWVDQIIRGLPEFTFALYFIGATRESTAKQHYTLPDNVLSLTPVYLHDQLPEHELQPATVPPHQSHAFYQSLRSFYLGQSMTEQATQLWPVLDTLDACSPPLRFGNLLRDRQAWDILQETYEQFSPDESFIDFFWTTRFLHLPLWTLWRDRANVPRARLYHTVSAGYAGLVAAIAARRHHARFLLTEHGIYTKERITEIAQASWIYEGDPGIPGSAEGLGKLKQLWINLFTFLGQVAYTNAAQILTLYEGNATTQIEFGAPPDKIQIIPNGIDPQKFQAVRDQIDARWNPAPARKSIGFIGRVVPIKDVKTLLRAARIVCDQCQDVEFLIAGPYAEDPLYFEECQKIVKLLGIEPHVKFLGMQKLMDVLPTMDVMVLTSISEGLPLVVLEAMAAGLPVVASDVGACRELIFGRTPDDRALGRAGRLTKIMSPAETAAALVHILQHPDTWRQMGRSGTRRAEGFYTMRQMLQSYRDLYRHHIQSTPFQGN